LNRRNSKLNEKKVSPWQNNDKELIVEFIKRGEENGKLMH
jgi:hypothetical protein